VPELIVGAGRASLRGNFAARLNHKAGVSPYGESGGVVIGWRG
jgi:hypothetical protein